MDKKIVHNIKNIALAAAGGYVGGMVSNAVTASNILGSSSSTYAPVVTLAAGVLLSGVKNDMVASLAEGMAIVAGTELLQNLTSPTGKVNGLQFGFVPQALPEGRKISVTDPMGGGKIR